MQMVDNDNNTCNCSCEEALGSLKWIRPTSADYLGPRQTSNLTWDELKLQFEPIQMGEARLLEQTSNLNRTKIDQHVLSVYTSRIERVGRSK